MKVTFRAWQDTKNVDLLFEAESDAEKALLILMQDRKFEWSMANPQSSDKWEAVLRPAAGRAVGAS